MRLFFASILLVSVLSSAGQETSKTYNHALKFTPLSIVGIPFPAVELSYEQLSTNRFASQITASYLLPSGARDRGSSINANYKGFSLGFEERWYYQKRKAFGSYVAAELHYLKALYTEVGHFEMANAQIDSIYIRTSYADTVSANRQTFTLNLKWGIQFNNGPVVVDIYAGIGLRYRDVRFYNQINPDDVLVKPRHPNLFYQLTRKGQYWTVNIPINVRLGYAF